jgi:AcrR family transcriptional regulator
MSRPIETEKRRELARRAVEVLRAEGMEVSMTRLAEVLELKRPTLIYHFQTRADIIVVALEDMLMEQTTFVLKRIAEHTHPIDRLYARVTAVHEFHHNREERVVFLTQAVVAIGRERLHALIEMGNAVFETHRRAQEAHVKQGIEDGIVHPCDVDALMTLMRSLTDGLLVQRVLTVVAFKPSYNFIWERILVLLKVQKEIKK